MGTAKSITTGPKARCVPAEQGAVSDRLQLRSSFLLAPLPAAGEYDVGRLRGRSRFAEIVECGISKRMDIIWDGVRKAKTLTDEARAIRHRLANATRSYNWNDALTLLSKHPELINTTRLDGLSLYSPLHQAAHGGAPTEVVEQMLKLGAWRTLQNSKGERPVDVAGTRNHKHLISVLRPRYKHNVPLGVLLKIQQNFHDVIIGRAQQFVEEHNLRLPELEPMLELNDPKLWFAVPGMYGGFHYWLEVKSAETKLVTESWCRIHGGSGQRHEITSAGSQLMEEGFV